MSDEIYNAHGLIPVLKEAVYELIECGALTLTTVCNVEHELKGIENFSDAPDCNLMSRCQELVDKISRLGRIVQSLEISSSEMITYLMWELDYDEKREHWYVTNTKGD